MKTFLVTLACLALPIAHASQSESFFCDSLELQSQQHMVGSTFQIEIQQTLGKLYTTAVAPHARPQLASSLELGQIGSINSIYMAKNSRTPIEFVRTGRIGVLSFNEVGRIMSYFCEMR